MQDSSGLRWCSVLAGLVLAGGVAGDQAVEHFERKVRPLLAGRCHQCHSAGAAQPKGGLRLDSREALLKGGDSGPAVVSGEPDRSLLIRAVRHVGPGPQMPPEGKERLSVQEVADLETWVRQGAPYPPAVAVRPPDVEEARRTWAFRPVSDPPVPVVRRRDWPRNPVDNFVLARLEQKGLTPAAPADRRTLLRRVTFDLIGLPPAPDEMDAALADPSELWYERAVERLLASPHYGERWGRHWLDVVRYADTAGDAADYPVPQAYRYRNYVIRSYNRDTPYDQFLREQIAGDLLPAPAGTGGLTPRRSRPLPPGLRPKNPADLLAAALKDLEPAVKGAALQALEKVSPKATAAVPALEELVRRGPEPVRELAAAALMSIDPDADGRLWVLPALLQRRAQAGGKYRGLLRRIKVAKDVGQYSLFQDYGISEAYPQYEGYKDLPKAYWVYVYPYWYLWAREEKKGRGTELWRELPGEEQYLAANSEQVIATGFVTLARRYGIYPERDPHLTIEDMLETLGRSVLGLGLSCARCHDHKFDPITQKDYYALYGIFSSSRYPTTGSEGIEGIPYQRFFVPLVPPSEAEAVLGPFQRQLAALEVELEQAREKRGAQSALRARRDALIAQRPVVPTAYALSEATPHNVRLHLRGDPRRLGPEVPRGFLRVLGGQVLPASAKGSGRLELAGWLTDRRNPLTARVMVNRLWQHHFGKGLVPTPNDFGARGVPPTHPELLDWLAARFVEGGWSVKAMHRLMVLSQTYRMGSEVRAENAAVDPDNNLLWWANRRRLDAESLRDALLAVSGRLDRSPGGVHPFPAEHRWAFVCVNPFAAVYETDRRSVYLMQARHRLHPFLERFDGANPNVATGDRRTSTTPVQALYLMNNPFVLRQAEALADRLLAEHSADDRRARHAYRLALAREPDLDEVERCLAFLGQARARLKAAGLPEAALARGAWAALAQVLFGSNEFVFVD